MGVNLQTYYIRHLKLNRHVFKYLLLVPSIFALVGYPWIFLSLQMSSTVPVTIGTDMDQYLIPQDNELSILSDLQLLDMFTKYINSFQIMCRNHKRLGSLQDGGKELCADTVVLPKAPCLVYSFGKLAEDTEADIVVNNKIIHFVKNSNNQFDFEDAVIKNYGCEVLTFDPTMGHIAKQDIHIPKGGKFFPQGLDGEDIPSKHYYRMSTLLNEHGHKNRIIDILKIDIEGSEWAAIEDMKLSGVLRNVRHLMVEFHFHKLPKAEKIRALRVFRILHEYGFRAYSRDINPGKSEFIQELGYRVSYFVDISFINIRFI